jgi:hypothetical protein
MAHRRPIKALQERGARITKEQKERLDNFAIPGDWRIPDGAEEPELRILADIALSIPEGVLGQIDSAAIAALCRFHKMYRIAFELWEKEPLNGPARLACVQAFGQVKILMLQLGLTPVGRASMPAPSIEADAFAAIVEGQQ